MGAVHRLGFLSVTALALAGCGGGTDDDDEGMNCGAVEGCGGDLVGQWNVVDVCVTGSPPADNPECEGAISWGQVDASGTVELTADGQTSSMLDMTAHVTYTFTEACLSAQSGTSVMLDQAACDATATRVSQAENVTSVTCTLSGDACVCPATFQTATEGQGTYTTSGTDLIDSEGDAGPYCVSGSTLRFSTQTDSGMTITYVLERVTR